MKNIMLIIAVLFYILQIAQTTPVTEKTGSTGSILNKESKDKMPKLRILIITTRMLMTESHYQLHRKLAELLAADTENVEKVLLFANNANSAEQFTEVPAEFDGRLELWSRTTLRSVWHSVKKVLDAPTAQTLMNWSGWGDSSVMFKPSENMSMTSQLDFLLNHQDLIGQLDEFKFNVGILETTPWDFSMSTFRALPSIKKFVGSQSTAPTIAQWKYCGYDKIVGAMPGRDLAKIGDHKFATESAIRKNPNYFRARNENEYIKPNERSTKLVENQFKDAIRDGKLPMDKFGDLMEIDGFSEWDLKDRMELYFTNTQPFLDFPIVEQEIEREKQINNQNRVKFIGGITMPRGKVPNMTEDTNRIFHSAKNGVVLLSFGSAVVMDDTEERAVSLKNTVVDLFKQYPEMNMIIKWGKRNKSAPSDTMNHYEKLSENVYAKSWLEQLAILGGKPKLFITHGGQNSINEAVKFGIPIILYPFFGDQFSNAEAMAARGVAKVLDIHSKTLGKDLAEAMNEILANYSVYQQKIDELSKKLNSIDPAKEFVEEFRQLRKNL